MDYLALSDFENLWILVLLAVMVIVDDHANVGMLYRAHHLQSFSARGKNVALLMAQGLDCNDKFVLTCDLARHPQKLYNLLVRAMPRKSFRNVARSSAAPNHHGSSEMLAACQTRFQIIS